MLSFEDEDIVDNVKYIGITSRDVAWRTLMHKQKHDNKRLARKLRKYDRENKKYTVSTLRSGLTKQRAEFLEKYLIKVCRILGFDLFNIHEGGGLPPIMYGDDNPSKRPEVAAKISSSNLGRKWSKESKERYSEICKKRKRSEQTKKKISERTSGKNNPRYGCVVSETQKEKTRLKLYKEVFQYSVEGELLNKYSSAKDAQEKTGINKRGISDCARGGLKTSGDFVWKYE